MSLPVNTHRPAMELTGEHYDVSVEASTVFFKKLHVRARNNEGLKTSDLRQHLCALETIGSLTGGTTQVERSNQR
jgi:hypothetical protein